MTSTANRGPSAASHRHPSGAVTPAIFRHLVDLAALDMEADEAEYLRGELNSQLLAIRELEAIEVGQSTPITSHGVPFTPENSPALREDVVAASEAADEILAQAPRVDGRYIVVPDIPHTDLE